MLTIALVGAGDAAQHHLRALTAMGAIGERAEPGSLAAATQPDNRIAQRAQQAPPCRLVALVVRDATRAAFMRATWKLPATVTIYPTFEALLAAGCCHAVILATPDSVHAAQVIAAAHAGLHVLVEKPLALNGVEAEQCLAAVRARQVCLRVGYHLRHHGAHVAMMQALPKIGQLQRVAASWAWPDPNTTGWRAAGAGRYWSLAALGTHGIDLALWFAQRQLADTLHVTKLTALSLRPERIGGGLPDALAEVTFVCNENVVCHVASAVCYRAPSRLLLTGTDGELEAVGTFGAHGEGRLTLWSARGAGWSVPFTSSNPYLAQLSAFVRAASVNEDSDATTLLNITVLDRVFEALGS